MLEYIDQYPYFLYKNFFRRMQPDGNELQVWDRLGNGSNTTFSSCVKCKTHWAVPVPLNGDQSDGIADKPHLDYFVVSLQFEGA